MKCVRRPTLRARTSACATSSMRRASLKKRRAKGSNKDARRLPPPRRLLGVDSRPVAWRISREVRSTETATPRHTTGGGSFGPTRPASSLGCMFVFKLVVAEGVSSGRRRRGHGYKMRPFKPTPDSLACAWVCPEWVQHLLRRRVARTRAGGNFTRFPKYGGKFLNISLYP
jgi:hypothetical protein